MMHKHAKDVGAIRPIVAALVGIVALSGCGADSSTFALQTRDAANALWSIQFDHHAVNLALAGGPDTVHLHATPRNRSDQTIDVPATVEYRTDASAITVDPDGLVTAKSVTDGALIIATVTSGGLTVSDSAIVRVEAAAPTGPLTLSIQPDSADSATTSLSNPKMVIVHSSATLATFFATSDPSVLTVDRSTGVVAGQDVGSATVYASTWAYGTVLRDSLQFTITAPLLTVVSIESRTFVDSLTPQLFFNPASVTVGVGASVIWSSSQAGLYNDLRTDVTFDDPSAALVDPSPFFPPTGAGNIDPFPLASDSSLFRGVRSRQFTRKGVFRYFSKRYGTTGQVVVK